MKIVVALGGNAFLRRGEPPTIETQRFHVRRAAIALAALAARHELTVTHGNGPQVGLLALQAETRDPASPTPLDVVGAETCGMIGYLLEQELGNALDSRRLVTVLTRTEVRADDPAFGNPTKPIGAIYDAETAERVGVAHGWRMARDGAHWRRVVASPEPIDVLEIGAIEHLRGGGFLVICAGGGGVPVRRTLRGGFEGVEAVIDKDLAAELLARRLGADALLLLTDVPAVFEAWGTAGARRIRAAHPDAMSAFHFDAGSMAPKVEAARRFATLTGGRAYIGALEDAAAIVQGHAGTCISTDSEGVRFEEAPFPTTASCAR